MVAGMDKARTTARHFYCRTGWVAIINFCWVNNTRLMTSGFRANCRLVLALLAALYAACAAAEQPRARVSLDFDWKFALGDPASAAAIGFDDSHWRKLNVPHDWSIEGPFVEDSKAGKAGGYAP